MLRIANPIGKAYMVTNPARRGRSGKIHHPSYGEFGMLRIKNRRRSRRRSSSRRRRNFAMAIESGPVTGVIPNMKALTDSFGTIVVGTGAFMANHALGVLVDKALTASKFNPTARGATGAIKFIGRWLGARAAAATMFRMSKGPLSRTNGRFIVNLSLITGALALARDLDLFKNLSPALQDYIPQLSAYESGIHKSQLSGRRRRLSAYESGIHRGQLSGYESGVQRSQLSSYGSGFGRSQLSANYDMMPVEQIEVSNYGIPFGA